MGNQQCGWLVSTIKWGFLPLVSDFSHTVHCYTIRKTGEYAGVRNRETATGRQDLISLNASNITSTSAISNSSNDLISYSVKNNTYYLSIYNYRGKRQLHIDLFSPSIFCISKNQKISYQ